MVPPWETTRIVFQQATRGKGCSFCELQFAVLAQIVFLGPNSLGSGFVGDPAPPALLLEGGTASLGWTEGGRSGGPG